MNKTLLNVKRYWNYLLGRLPSELPNGMAAFDAWAKSFIETYDLPTLNEYSIKWVLATAIMRLDPQVAFKPKHYFYLTLKAAAAKQIAGAVFEDLKNQQKAAQQAAAQPVATNSQAANNEQVLSDKAV